MGASDARAWTATRAGDLHERGRLDCGRQSRPFLRPAARWRCSTCAAAAGPCCPPCPCRATVTSPPPCPPPRIPFDRQNARLDVLSWSKSSGQSQLVKFNWSKPTGQSRLIKVNWSKLACALSALSIRAARGLRRCLNGALAAARAGPRIRPVLAEASPIRTPLVGGSLAASLTGPRPEATRRSRGEGTCAHPCTHRVH